MQPDSLDIGAKEDFVIYRLQTAEEFLQDAVIMLNNNSYKTCANRIYYSVYKSLSALHAVDGNQFKKHKANLEFFSKNYIKEGIFPVEYGEMVYRIQKLRHSSDYDDFKTPSPNLLQEYIEFAKTLMWEVSNYCQGKIQKKIVLQSKN